MTGIAASLWMAGMAWGQEPDCPEVERRRDWVDAAATALVEADLERTRTTLAQLDAALTCGAVVDPEVLGRTWLVQGALDYFEGDASGARRAFHAAARVAPGSWYEDFGSQLRDVYEAASPPPDDAPLGILSLDPRPINHVAAVDGRTHTDFPMQLEPGLHVVQVGPSSDNVFFGRQVLVVEGEQVVATGLREAGTVPAPSLPTLGQADPARDPWLRIHTGLGVALSVGRGDGPAATPTLLSVPLETGLTFRSPAGPWARMAVVAAPLLTGDVTYTDRTGEAVTPTQLGVHASVGLRSPQGDMGVLFGRSWPLGWSARAVVAGRLPVEVPLGLEGRLGLDLLQGGSPSPSVEFLVVVVPDLTLR
ncbi:MAG: hypothetical protein KTR31_05615 [Myxococcales bacterium]|nr:hypothetical protein [Myxococcales bacterium]